MNYNEIINMWAKIYDDVFALSGEIERAIAEKKYSGKGELTQLEDMLSSLEDMQYIM